MAPPHASDSPTSGIQRYLGTKEVVVLATLGADGAPHGMAMWFLHTPDAILMLTVADLQKVRDLRRDPRVAMVAESVVEGGPRGVSGSGPCRDPRRVTRAARLRRGQILAKYHPRARAAAGAPAPMPSQSHHVARSRPATSCSWGLG